MKKRKRNGPYETIAEILAAGIGLTVLGAWGGRNFVGIGLALLLVGCLALWWQKHKATATGALGEAVLGGVLTLSLDPKTYSVKHNLMMPLDDGTTTQIDFVVVSTYGVFVIEAKTYQGWIFGAADQAQWTQCLPGGKKFRFQNPLRQNYAHVKALSDRTGIPPEYFHSVIAFCGDTTFKTEMPPNVVYFGGVADHIRSFTEPMIKPEQVPEVLDAILSWDRSVSKEARKAHVENLKKKHG